MRPTHLTFVVLAGGLLAFGVAFPAPPPAEPPVLKNVRAIGKVAVDKGILTVTDARATLVIGKADADTYCLTAEVKMADKANRILLHVMPVAPGNASKPAALYGSFYRDAPGLRLQADASRWDAAKRPWGRDPVTAWYTYWPPPTDKATLALMDGSGLAPRHLKDHWLRLRIEADRRQVRFWLDGLLVSQVERPAGVKGPVTLTLAQGDQVRNVALAPLPESLYLPVDLTPFAHDRRGWRFT